MPDPSPPVAATGTSADPADRPRTAQPARGAPAVWREAARTRLVLVAHAPRSPTAQVLQVALEPRGAGVFRPFDVPALPGPTRPKDHHVVAAHDGGDTLAVARSAGPEGPWFVDLHDLQGDGPWQQVRIPHAAPAALRIAGGWVIVGHAERLSAFRLADPEGSFTQICHRPELRGKAYDIFARDGSYLVAIDDMRSPMYADSVELLQDGPRHIAGYQLPGVTGGHYLRAALRLDDNGDGRLFAESRFGHMRAGGHELLVIAFVGGAPASLPHPCIGSPTLAERVHATPGRPPDLFGGDEATRWSGLVVAADGRADRVLIAAETRGIFSLPADFGYRARPAHHVLGGQITDLLAHGEHTWALRVADGATQILRLDLSASDALGARSIATVAEAFCSFVH